MKLLLALAALPLLLAPAWFPAAASPTPPAPAQRAAAGWTTGAQGTLGHVTYTQQGSPHTIDLAITGEYRPDLWVVILDYESLTIAQNAVVRFLNHPSRAPIVIRSRGDITIRGTMQLDGQAGHGSQVSSAHSEPGPGGFRGGTAQVSLSAGDSAGHGPGGGFLPQASTFFGNDGGYGSHATLGHQATTTGMPGALYSSSACVPLIGGSGGSGGRSADLRSSGGGAGGGAILLGSDSRISLSGAISARGGATNNCCIPGDGGPGSGGMIRIAAPEFLHEGGGLDARGGIGNPSSIRGGDGRIRVETATNPGTINALPVPTHAALGEFLPALLPTVTLQAWFDDTTGQRFEIGQDPRARISSALEADVQLPSTGQRRVRLAGRGVPLDAPLEVRVTNTRGQAVVIPAVMGSAGGDAVELWSDVMIDFGADIATVQVRALLQ